MRKSCAALLTLAATGCAGGPPAAPLVWPVGAYVIEATITYQGGFGTQRETHVADLYVEPDRTVRLDSQTGSLCQEPTLPEMRSDERRGVRTFRCGNLTWELRPAATAVSGELRAEVEETYVYTECVEYGPGGTCVETISSIGTRTVVKEEPIQVRPRPR